MSQKKAHRFMDIAHPSQQRAAATSRHVIVDNESVNDSSVIGVSKAKKQEMEDKEKHTKTHNINADNDAEGKEEKEDIAKEISVNSDEDQEISPELVKEDSHEAKPTDNSAADTEPHRDETAAHEKNSALAIVHPISHPKTQLTHPIREALAKALIAIAIIILLALLLDYVGVFDFKSYIDSIL